MAGVVGTGATVTTTIATTVSGRREVYVTEYVDNDYRAYPLTDIYTPVCSSIFGFDDFDSEECVPPDFDVIWESEGYYSPGICWSGYTAGCSLTYRDLKPGQTAFNCVPSGWDCSIYTFQAASINNNGDEVSAPAAEIRWEESDLPFLETHPLIQGLVVTPSDTDGPEPTGEPPEDPGGDGVSTGAAVGIALGVATFVVIVCGAAFIWYRKRWQGKDASPAGNPDAPSMEKPGKPELYAGPPDAHIPTQGQPTELVGAHYHTSDASELHGRDLLPELPPAEVDGTSGGKASPAGKPGPNFQVPRRPVGGQAGATGTGA